MNPYAQMTNDELEKKLNDLKFADTRANGTEFQPVSIIEQAAMLNQSAEAILVRDLGGGIRFWNQGAERLYGWTAEEVIGRSVQEFMYRGDSSQADEAMRAVIEKGKWVGEIHQFTKDGREIMVEDHWTLLRNEKDDRNSILAINIDITEKKILEAQLRRAQRLESIGTLAGGIAHDLNNILTPIVMSIHMLQQQFTSEEQRRWLEILRTNAQRGADLVKQVLTFTRGAEGQHTALTLRHLVKDLILMLNDTIPKSIEIKSSIPNDLWFIKGDVTQLYQMLMNLCVNARDAMPTGGRLMITAENTRLDETYAQMRFGAYTGRFVLLTVTDTGVGIPSEIVDKIFDPFFTTKPYGQGTGLGLSTTLGIVKSHGGLIDVQSQPGRGTTFSVYLPALETGELRQAGEKHAQLPAGHGESILVVDDEAAIREILSQTFESFGYKVLTADDGPEAIMQFVQHKEKISVVLLDLMMPIMDGAAIIHVLRNLDADVPIIATSGLEEKINIDGAVSAGAQAFLSKPYTTEKLLKTLAEILSPERNHPAS